MPFQMSGNVQSVIIQERVYIGGGGTGLGNSYTVMAYDISSGKWAELPPYIAQSFGMTVVNSQLVPVGGKEQDNIISTVVGVWRQKWTHPYPDMPTPRSHCSAVAHKEWLVVAGGEGEGGADLHSVEVLNTDAKQWSAGPPIPTPWSYMCSAIVGEACYFMGGFIENHNTNLVYSVSLPALTSHLNSSSGARDSQIWKKISGLQVKGSSPLSISGSLLAVGGKDKGGAVSGFHLYQPDIGEWTKVGDLPAPRYQCTCTALTNRELLVAGGEDAYGYRLKSVDIALMLSATASIN